MAVTTLPRTLVREVRPGEDVRLQGAVQTVRALGGLVFIVLPSCCAIAPG